MKVKCLYNTGKNLSQKFLNDGWIRDAKLDLDLNRESLIYGISFFKNDCCYYLVCEKHLTPLWYPDEIFQITETKLSIFWHYTKCNELYDMQAIWGYYELVNNDSHCDNLMEREKKDLEIFYRRKKQMDLEFSEDSIKDNATITDRNRLVCSNCIDTWESHSTLAMVECPKCKTIMHNPRYTKW